VTYEWDPAKAVANVRKHGVSFEEAASVLPRSCRAARRRVLFVAHTERGERLRIISARLATRREQDQYEEGIDQTTP
jgi:hypothetical protein